MAINKKLIHFKTFANFNSLKLSANEANTKYTTGISGAETSGNPDILYQSICFIKDTQQIWTHGLIYNASAENKGGPYFVDMSLYGDGQTGPEIEELYNNLVNALLDNRPIYIISPSSDGDMVMPVVGIYLAGFKGVILYASINNGGNITSISYAVYLLNGEYILEEALYEKDLYELVNTYDLATINGQSLINGGQDIIILCGGNEIPLNTTDISEAHSIVLDAYVNNKPLTAVGHRGEKVVITRFYADELSFVIQYVDADEIFGLQGMNKIITVTFFMEDGEYVVDTSVVPIPTNLNELEGTEGLVYKTNLATINGQSLLNGGDITIEGGTSGVFVKFNELFAEGTITTNESDVFNVVKTAMESNTPLLLCDNNYSIILVSHYPLKVGNTIIASGTLSLDVYNFTFTSGSNQITVTKLSVATLSDNLVSALGLKSPLGKTYALPDADAEAWADACLLSTEDGISRFLEYPDNHVGYLEGFFDGPTGNIWALPSSDLSSEVGLESTLASIGDTPSYYILNNSASPSTLELMGGSAPTRQLPGNIIAIMFSEQFQQVQEHEFVIEGNAWMLPEDTAVLAKGGETMLFVFSNDYIVPVGSYESFYAKKAEVLQVSRTINGVSFNGSSNITNYTTCSTAAATIAKTASLTGLTAPTTGTRVSINFTNGNTAALMTLNVNSTGDKSVVYRGNTNTPILDAGTYDFIYTGFLWELLSTKGINKFTINRAAYTGVVYPDSFIRFYYSTGVTTLNVSSTTMSSAFAEYSFEFNSGSTPTVFTYPSAWKWANGTAPTISANKTYHVSVVNNCAVIAEF